ncbi:MAG: PKD domain-containing protein, partial [Bacteroidia bacterium]|nr:PKD domain-containing protein [Bacteroidia bacterium]
PFVMWVEGLPDPGEPEDLRALALHRSNAVASDHPMGRHYNGAGINVQVRDDGGVGPHIDVQGRTEQSNVGGPGGGTHGDMVTGVFGGAGNLDPTTRGAAWGSFFYITQYESSYTDNTLSLHQNNDVLITNSSYSNGCNDGYTTITQRVDNQTYTNPTLLHMFSAGNSNGLNCGYGAGTEWGNITGGHKQGKNVMAVANLFPDGSLVGSSSRGPAHDGRIKPDVAANGNDQMSIDPFNTYMPGGGTSAASPSTAGVIAQLYQAYKELQGNGTPPPSALIKAIVLNTAEDYGIRGPDFKYGWGRINGLRAVKVIEDGRYLSGSISNGGSNTHNIEVPPGVISLKVMTYWMDPAATPGTSKALINDLDTDISGVSGTHLPWLTNPTPSASTLNFPATKGADHLNNMEQVQIDNPTSGTHVLTVNGFSVPQGPQEYFVIIEYITEEIEVTHPIGGEGFAPGEQTRVHWDAHGNFGPFNVHYSTDNGSTWHLISSGIAGATRFINWTVPSELSGAAKVRVSRGSNVGVSPNTFSIIGIPRDLEVVQVCLDKITLKWSPVQGAIAYDVFQLGAQFMDSVGSTTETSFTLDIVTPFQENWVSVRARTADDQPGRRAIAVTHPIGGITCTTGNDLQVRAIPSIGDGNIPSCADTIRFTLEILNSGNTPQSNFQVGYWLAGQTLVVETITDTIAPSGILLHTVAGGYLPSQGVATNIALKGFVGITADAKPSNDTLYTSLKISNQQFINPPFTQTFEGFGGCSTASNCGSTTCGLGGGWTNEQNFLVDAIDWRVNNGTTPSGSTGPSFDHTSGSPSGKYLYLEASNNCYNSEAILTSPCVFLGTTQKPVLSLWYHMYGSDMGSLHIDIFDGEAWQQDVAVVAGEQGDEWKQLTVDLSYIDAQFFSFRVRGITGPNFYSDLAIDDISVIDAAQAPVADFTVTRQEVCPGDEVSFSDLSTLNPDTYSWTFSPATISYLAGSSASSASPLVAFSQTGTYDASLIVSNAYGSDTLSKTVYVTASHGRTLPVFEDFQSGTFPPAGWGTENGDASFGWDAGSVIGSSGGITATARMNNYQYPDVGQEDLLSTFNIDLRTAISPQLSFDVAYTSRNANTYDELRVVISDNCGQSFLYPIYQKGLTDLQTAPFIVSPFIPNGPSQWRRDSLDLTQFVGQTISIGFVNLTGTGNYLYLDNVNIVDAVTVAPQTTALASVQEICVGEMITFSDSSLGNNLAYTWDLGPGGNPGTFVYSGSFQATYTSPGLKTVVLTVSNAGGSSSDTLMVMVNPLPEAAFTPTISGGFQSYAFANSSSDASSWSWDFGDGSTSSDSLPTHTYLQNGDYTVTLVVTGPCGTDTATSRIVIDNVSIEGSLGNLSVRAFPNPADDVLVVEVEGNELKTSLQLILSDLRGKEIISRSWDVNASNTRQELSVADLPAGIYVIRLTNEQGQFTRRVIVR